ncbi:MAG: ABC transporter ATP-binding protein [Desulfarculaceae bacterium]|nr:ABC transporter ATP-binding protein [Desulfarculaceae bacterium]MCF8073892.1 ABC transporter ATP-binding protein [Desulfarculaceae bacterium]MCF8102872.1 ABC transporter ATP-binding protein [Desulfarculaceae bacterium]MCF8116316.1 ABC transporter ATP-binding protein [Desulfarculaceae bacterium]
MLTVRDLTVSYGGITALRGVELEVRRGEIVTLVGANGAGKSTLLGAISGLIKPAAGSITYRGQEVAGTKAHRLSRRGLILVPEGRRIFVNLSVKENLILGGYFRPHDAGFSQDLERVLDTFPRLAERADQPAGTLSGGERQMLALGRGLMGSPKLMMLDEPSLGLAPLMVAEVFGVIRRIHEQGVTVLLVEQNAAAALKVADRAYVLETGKVVLSGTGKELAADGRVQRAYLGMD